MAKQIYLNVSVECINRSHADALQRNFLDVVKGLNHDMSLSEIETPQMAIVENVSTSFVHGVVDSLTKQWQEFTPGSFNQAFWKALRLDTPVQWKQTTINPDKARKLRAIFGEYGIPLERYATATHHGNIRRTPEPGQGGIGSVETLYGSLVMSGEYAVRKTINEAVKLGLLVRNQTEQPMKADQWIRLMRLTNPELPR